MKQEQDQEKKSLEEIARRVPAYMAEFKIKSYERALDRVLDHDKKLKAVYERAQGSATAELQDEAKTYPQAEPRMKWIDSIEAAASQQPELAKKAGGDPLRRGFRRPDALFESAKTIQISGYI